jgi:curli biogenesis system outer membrane secretion channel CsgG
MTRTPLLIMLAAAAALAGCNKENATTGNSEANAAVNAPIQLPPSIVATKLYRCADNSVVTVDYLSDSKTANVRIKDGPTAQVVAPEAGQPMVAAGGFSVEGGPTSATAKIGVPGHPAQSCKA